jgi:hypothetical protein
MQKPCYIYTKTLQKLFNINQTLKYLPFFYIGNKELDDYVTIANKILLKSPDKNEYKVLQDPYLFHALGEKYNILKINNSINRYHFKPLQISYTISQKVMRDPYTECD